MPKDAAMPFRMVILGAALSLAACNQRAGDAELAELDNQIVGNDADPALTSVLQDQILVDPALTQQSNKNALRPPETPTQAQYPLPPEAEPGGQAAASSQAGRPQARTAAGSNGAPEAAGTADCAAALQYGPAWARRLPGGFALYPGGRLDEAAGTDRSDCRARIVTFITGAAPQQVIDWYRSRAAGAGYTAEDQVRGADQILAGANAQSGGAYYLILTPRAGGGSEVALIVNGG